MREISQVVAPKTITQSNRPKIVRSGTGTRWNKVLPNGGADREPIVLRPYQIEAVQSVGSPNVGGQFTVFIRTCACADACLSGVGPIKEGF